MHKARLATTRLTPTRRRTIPLRIITRTPRPRRASQAGSTGARRLRAEKKMNWISEWALPKIKTLFGATREMPDNLWHKCPSCEKMIFLNDLEANLRVCTHCGHHMRLSSKQRLDATFDAGWQRAEIEKVPLDPLRFKDQRRYSERLKEAQTKSGMDDAVLVGHGKLENERAVIAVFEFSFMAGSMGAGVGEALVTAARLAVLQDAPLVVFASSGGARMQEGAVSLMQMPRTVIATQMVKDAGLPFIVVLCDPTTGGVTASFAMLGDIQIAEPGALIGFAGARVIEQTVREKLPEGFQRAEYLLANGILDMVVKRAEMRPTLARLLRLLRGQPSTATLALPRPEAAPAE